MCLTLVGSKDGQERSEGLFQKQQYFSIWRCAPCSGQAASALPSTDAPAIASEQTIIFIEIS